MMDKHIPQEFRVTERGVRGPAKHCPHNIIFPAMVSALKTFMGLPPRTHDSIAHGIKWRDDDDYFFYMGVSGEGFTLCYNMLDFLQEGKWNNQSLDDCFAAEGIKYRLFGDGTIPVKDTPMNPDTVGEQIVQHLLSDRPVILFREKVSYKLVVGYTDYGNTLIAHGGHSGVRIGKTAKPLESWKRGLSAVIFIDGIDAPGDRKEIAWRSLFRAYEMLTEKDQPFLEYGYGEGAWWKWIYRLEDDRNYRAKNSNFRYINPEKFDLAERRAYTAGFFEQVQDILKIDLSVPARIFRTIHDKMWDVHWQVYGENKRSLRDKATRERIVWFLKECRDLERQAAAAIGQVLLENDSSVPDQRSIAVWDVNGNSMMPAYPRRAKG